MIRIRWIVLGKQLVHSPESPIQKETQDNSLECNLAEFLKQWPISKPLTFKRLLQQLTVLTRQKTAI